MHCIDLHVRPRSLCSSFTLSPANSCYSIRAYDPSEHPPCLSCRLTWMHYLSCPLTLMHCLSCLLALVMAVLAQLCGTLTAYCQDCCCCRMGPGMWCWKQMPGRQKSLSQKNRLSQQHNWHQCSQPEYSHTNSTIKNYLAWTCYAGMSVVLASNSNKQ